MSVSEDEPTLPEMQQQAIDWLVLLRADRLDEKDMYAFADWLSRDHRHPEAFAAAEDLFNDMVIAANTAEIVPLALDPIGNTAAVRPGPGQRRSKSRKREGWRIAWALAACWILAVILVMQPPSRLLTAYFSDYHTETGEWREVALSDGSRLLLNTHSAVSVSFDDEHRQITLHYGQVRFTVAKEPNRPFEVAVADLKVRALGTIFTLSSLDAGESSVIVQEHAVSVRIQSGSNSEDAGNDQVKVQQGQQLRHQSGTALRQPEPVELEQATAWQSRRLVINDRPLGELIAELNRYRAGHIFLSGADLTKLRISGVFSLDHPDSTLDTVQAVLGLKQTRLGNWWVVLHH